MGVFHSFLVFLLHIVCLYLLHVCFDLLPLGVRSFLLGEVLSPNGRRGSGFHSDRTCCHAIGIVIRLWKCTMHCSGEKFVKIHSGEKFERAHSGERLWKYTVKKSLRKRTVEKSGVHSDRICCQPAYCHLTDHTLHLIQHHRYNHTKGPSRKKFYQEICLHKNLVGQVWVSYAQSAINSSSTLCACAVENPFSGILRNQEIKLVCPLWPTDYRVTDPA